MREGWLRGRAQKLEDNGGRKKRALGREREYRERTSAGRVLAWRRSEPSVRLPSSSSRKARLVYLCPSLHVSWYYTNTYASSCVTTTNTKKRQQSGRVRAWSRACTRSRTTEPSSLSLSPVHSFPFPGEPHTGCSRMCVLTEREQRWALATLARSARCQLVAMHLPNRPSAVTPLPWRRGAISPVLPSFAKTGRWNHKCCPCVRSIDRAVGLDVAYVMFLESNFVFFYL